MGKDDDQEKHTKHVDTSRDNAERTEVSRQEAAKAEETARNDAKQSEDPLTHRST